MYSMHVDDWLDAPFGSVVYNGMALGVILGVVSSQFRSTITTQKSFI